MSRYAAFIVLAGCIANHGDEGMVVLNNTAPSGATCTLTGDPSQPFISHGVINLLSLSGYGLTPLIQSRISPLMNGDPAERTILLQGANIDLAVASATSDGASVTVTLPADATHFKQLFSGALPAAGSINVGFELIPADALVAIAQQTNAASARVSVEVISTSTIFGTLGGDQIESTPFSYAVTVCSDCVINDLGPCAGVVGTVRTGDACNVFQDGIVDCCEDAVGTLVCPAAAPGA